MGWSSGVSSVTVVGSAVSSSSSFTSSSEASKRHEVDSIYNILKKETHDDSKITIAVVRPESFSSLENKLSCPWWKFWKPNPGVFVTTPCWLQRTIDHIEEESPCQKLTLLFSKKIDKIEFHIEPSVRALRILRCHHSRESRSRVLISGSSTFGSVRLDEWQDRRHRHQLFLGDGVCINVNMQSEGTPWAAYVTGLSSQQKEQIYGHFLCMKRDNGEGPQWNQWKKHMAMVVGLLSGLDRIVYPFEVTPTGCFVEYRFGAAAYTPLSEARTVMSSAGAAYSLGPKVAAPVYFISWNSLMKWVRGGLWVVCQSYWAVLENLVQVVIGRLSGTPANIIIPTRPGIQRSKSSREGKRVSWKAREALVSHSYIGGH